ncbi:hypothetical protein [Desulfosporosinus burensis]
MNLHSFGRKDIKEGGMEVEVMLAPGLGDGVDSIQVVNVCLTVYVDLDWNQSLFGRGVI